MIMMGQNVKIVLWLSRHEPLPAQLRALRERLGEYRLITHREPVATAEHAVELVRRYGAQYVVAVLPLSFIARLVEEANKTGEFVVVWAEMTLIHNCTTQPCPLYNPDTDTIMRSVDQATYTTIYRHYRFREFMRIRAVEIVKEPL